MSELSRFGTVVCVMNARIARSPRLRRLRPAPIRWIRTHPDAADAILATLLTIGAVVVHVARLDTNEEYIDPTWWTVPLVVLSVFPIAWRRRHPIGAASVVVAAQVVATFIDTDGAGFIGVLIALYSVGAHSFGPARTRLLIATLVAIDALFIAGLIVDELNFASFISSVVILVTAFVLGDNLRRRRDAAAALQERLGRAERERELIGHQRVSAERTRIARELHDVVAHSVSVMVIQAAAARRSLSSSSPENAEIALANVEHTGRQTMTELRGILGVLRHASDHDHEPADSDSSNSMDTVELSGVDEPRANGPLLEPQPRLDAIPALVEASIDLPITLSMLGEFADLASSVDLTGYRTVQESLTNVRRHAGPVSSVEVSIERRDDLVVIRVLDDGRGAAADQDGPGYGLLGMRERVDAVGGHLAAGWRVGGGWSVTATLPTSAHSTVVEERQVL